MKQFALLFVALFAFAATSLAQDEATFAEFNKVDHDFGKITDQEDAFTTFEFTNTSGTDLILNPPKASCGCTTPSYPKEPIEPGATKEIKVKYSTKNRIGKFVKSIRVYAQGHEQPIMLKIRGEVVSQKEISSLPKKEGNSLFK